MDAFLNAFGEAATDLGSWLGVDDLGDAADLIGKGASFLNKGSAAAEKDQAARAQASTNAANIGGRALSTRQAYTPSTSQPAQGMSAAEAEARWKSLIASYISGAESTAVKSASRTTDIGRIEKIINA